jgi:hypothetical protein
MTINFLNTYPPEATNKAWQKQKSFLDKAKSATKTGLGAELVKAEAEWKKFVPLMDALDVRSAVVGGRTVQSVQQAKVKAQQIVAGQAATTSAALIKAAAKAKSTAANTGLSKTARAAAANIEKKLLDQARKLRGIKLDDFDNMLDTLNQQQQAASNLLKPYITSIRKDGGDVKRNPTVANFVGKATTGFYQGTRGLNAAIVKSQNVALMKWGKTNWTPLTQAGFLPKQDSEVVAKVDQVLKKLAEFEKLLG